MGSIEKSGPIYLGIEESRLISDRVASLVGDCSRVGTCTCTYVVNDEGMLLPHGGF